MPQLGNFEIGKAELGAPAGQLFNQILNAATNLFAGAANQAITKALPAATAASSATIPRTSSRPFLAALTLLHATMFRGASAAFHAIPGPFSTLSTLTVTNKHTASTRVTGAVTKSTAKVLPACIPAWGASLLRIPTSLIRAATSQLGTVQRTAVATNLQSSVSITGDVSKSTTRGFLATTAAPAASFLKSWLLTISAALAAPNATVNKATGKQLQSASGFSATLTRSTRTLLASALSTLRAPLGWLIQSDNPAEYPLRRFVLRPDDRFWQLLSLARTWTLAPDDRTWTLQTTPRSWPLYPTNRSWPAPLDEDTMITTTKDPDAKEDFLLTWTAVLGTETIASSVWIVPNGLTIVQQSHTNTSTTVRLGGGKLGQVYIVKNLVTLASSGQVKPRSLQITIQTE